MGKRLVRWELGGAVFTAVMGVLLHFAYDWSGQSPWAAMTAAVNESVWEHMKLLFVPVFLFTMVQLWFLGRAYPNLLAARAVSTLTGLALIPTLFYTYMGVLGYGIKWVNISIFYLSALAAFALDIRLLRRGRFDSPWQQLLGLAALWALAFLFVWWTFRAPLLGLWRDPVAGGYGI